MDEFLLSGKQKLTIEEVQEFRAIAETLVDKSGIDLDFPEKTEPSILLKILLWILRGLGVLMAVYGFFIWAVGVGAGLPFIGMVIYVLLLGVCVTFTFGLVIIIPNVILYRDEQKQFRLELRTLMDITEAVVPVLEKQNHEDVEFEINRAERLIKKYREGGV